MKIEVLGTGCPKCKKTYKNAKKAIKELEVDGEVTKVYETAEIAKRGVMSTPALSINGEIKISGEVPGVEEIKDLIEGIN
ncbi:MAG: Thioredoxin [Candidatus Methanohalarchaeum thermophilum]|uniref:Thioredoxin n=1 Tax=Methanohalarchaeum thermophilum TaxID=1903181 RepID=A0A1Q6DWT4_METT1|nr:MAG: Thioredoxin [Candidatus Methanohalarchaeum thermophilum]